MRHRIFNVALSILAVSFLCLLLYDLQNSALRLRFYHRKVNADSDHSQRGVIKAVNGDNTYDNFPLSDDLMDGALYTAYSMNTFTDPYQDVIELSADHKFDEREMCDRLGYTATFEVSQQRFIEAEYKRIVDAISKNSFYYKLLDKVRKEHKSNIPEEKRWFRFGGSSIWLEEYNVHYMVSRVLYSPSGIPNKAFASFLYVQIFNKEGSELYDVSLSVPYRKKIENSIFSLDGNLSAKKTSYVIKRRTLTFPSVLPIKFDHKMKVTSGKYYWGPEDPRVVARRNSAGFIEPLIVFNMKNLKLVKRVMHTYLPFSKSLKVLKKRNDKYAYVEKNWTPFFSKQISKVTEKDVLNFVYSIDPLEVLSCEINTGVCDFIQKIKKKDYNYVGPLRGGTQLVPLPFDSIIPPQLKSLYQFPENRQVYVGWARTHLNDCGCGESMYRPNLIILVEDFNPETKKIYYKIADVSEYVDFNVSVPPWSVPKLDSEGNVIQSNLKQCEGRNVLIPNSIAFWKIFSIEKDGTTYSRKSFPSIKNFEEDAQNLIFNDYMGVTLSAADSDVSIVYLKGILGYIISIKSLFDISNVIQNDKEFQHRGFDLNQKCSVAASKEYCLNYAEENKGIFSFNL